MNPSIPKLDRTEFDQFASLTCPCCQETFLHQGRVEVFERQEDASHGLRVVVDGNTSTTDTSMGGNPSARRQGLRVYFECEICEAYSALCIVQHKGSTHIFWEL